ncbi:DUF6101 family protein [Methylocystis sp. IM2]|uniref:DUF6101 family protein n=1 Tax=unclassified Methylocystis TaxID=2625913 RepID=UPI0030FB85C8
MFEAGQAMKSDEAFFVQRDWRADGGARRVRVTRRDILIARRFNGVDMKIAVPVPAYRGVLLDVAAGEAGAPCYRLLLAHRDRDLDVVLGETGDSTAAAADWKYWAAWLDLPRLAAENGDFAEVDAPVCGAAAPGRRGGSSVRRRRPVFSPFAGAGTPAAWRRSSPASARSSVTSEGAFTAFPSPSWRPPRRRARRS